MNRHDTHLLSDESEKEEKEEDAHQYIFNSSQNSFKNSEEQYIIKEPNQNNDLYINIINSKKIETNNNNISIISSSEIDGNFGNTPNNKNNLTNNKKINNNKFIKLNKKRFIKDNNNLKVDNYLTYNPSLKKTIFDIKIKKYNFRNCTSLTDSNIYKNKKEYRSKLKRFKNLDSLTDKEILYYIKNDNIEGNKKLNNFLNIINKQKLKLLQITNDNFTIKNKKLNLKRNFPLLNKNQDNDYEREINIRKNNYSYKISYFSTKKSQNKNNYIINKNQKNNLLLKFNKSLNNKIAINLNFGKTPRKKISLNLKKKFNKIEELYNLYIGEQNNMNKKYERIHEFETFFGNKENNAKIKKYQKYKKYLDNRIKKNKKNIMKTLFQIRARNCSNNLDNFFNYSKHFGSNDFCPICKSIEQKNEESILKMGIHPMVPSIGNDNWKNIEKNRRAYSAFSRVTSKKTNKNNSEIIDLHDIYYDTKWNMSKNTKVNESKNKSISVNRTHNTYNTNNSLINKIKKNKSTINILNKNFINEKMNRNFMLKNKNEGFRKLNKNTNIYLQNDFSTNNKYYNNKYQSLEFY